METTLVMETAIKRFDRALDRHVIARMPLAEASELLAEIQDFYQDLSLWEGAWPAGSHLSGEPGDYDMRLMITAGCRICSDLTELLLMRLVDVVQDQQHSLDFLNAQLRKKVRDQYQASQLLKQTQRLRQEIFQTGERSGLGMIL